MFPAVARNSQEKCVLIAGECWLMASGRYGSNFSPAVRSIIARRAGFRCIVPGCSTPTVGPGAKSNDVALTGTACHIYSAAPKGPRGQGGLSPAQLAAPENGVWACATHGRLIDTNKGDRYPTSTLYASPLSVTPFAFQTAVNLNLWSKPEVWDANRNFTTGRF